MENQTLDSAAENETAFTIRAVKQAASDCVEITTEEGPVFFVRMQYLELVKPERIVPGASFSDDEAEDIMTSGFAFSAERKAVGYLSRSEQCRFGLERKLSEKSFDKAAVKKALDYLESKKYLDDARFARAWLRIRAISKWQGRMRLAKELAVRGIDRQTASDALDEFFVQYSEEDFCRKACQKAVHAGKSGDKLLKYLTDNGFSYRMSRSVSGEISSEEE
jgi:regulatory protein